MDLIANLLDRARAHAEIESDYRLAKVIGITHAAISSYRMKKSMPNEKILAQLCALSGDDVAVMAAQVQGLRAQSDEGKSLWAMVAARLQSDRRHAVRGVGTAILSVLFSIVLIAGQASEARASGLLALKTCVNHSLYIVSSTFLALGQTLYEIRLRWFRPFPGFSALRGALFLFYWQSRK